MGMSTSIVPRQAMVGAQPQAGLYSERMHAPAA
jgi:hypothetical protein